ncbi:MAG: hypothetical protein ACXADH_16115, partial [Candidatus Kariarchaeaceae archaeon]
MSRTKLRGKRKNKNMGWNLSESTENDNDTDIFDSSDLGQSVSADISDISNVLTEHVYKKMVETYDLAANISKDRPKAIFSTFQGLLKDYKDWDSKTRKLFTRKVRKNLRDLNNIVRSSIVGVAQIRYLWSSRTKGVSRRDTDRVLQAISLSRTVPATEDFLHWCCCRAVMDVYPQPYLFDNRKSLSRKMKNANKIAAKESIKGAVEDEMYSRNNANHIIQSAINYVQGGKKSLDYSESESESEEEHDKKPTKKKT